MKIMLSTAFVSLFIGVMMGHAHAELLHFSYEGSQTFSFDLDSVQTPNSVSDEYFSYSNITFDVTGSGEQKGKLLFNSNANDGGFTASINPEVATEGIQVFTGPVSNPMFQPGTFSLEEANSPSAGTLTISAVPLPPSAPLFAAALLGLGSLGYGARRKKAAASV